MPDLRAGRAANVRVVAPSALVTSTVGCRPGSGVRPCWRIVSVTCHGLPAAVPSGSELSPTVAKAPALAAPGSASATTTAIVIAARARIAVLLVAGVDCGYTGARGAVPTRKA